MKFLILIQKQCMDPQTCLSDPYFSKIIYVCKKNFTYIGK